MSDKPYDLLSRPDVATEVGFLIMYCANLDGWILPALSTIIQNPQVAYAIVNPIDNTSAKLDLLFNICNISPEDPFPKVLLGKKDATKKAVTFRNAICHGSFGFDVTTKDMHLQSNTISQRRGKPKAEPVDCKKIRHHALAIKGFIAAIMEQINSDFLVGYPNPVQQ